MKNPVRWDNLTSPEIKRLAEKEAIVLIPVGSTEQHGPHLPVGCDSLMATWMAEQVATELCNRGCPCVVTPTIAVANSRHHMNFAGSMSLSAENYMHVLADYCRCVAAHGFRKILVFNGHGGNNAPTQAALVGINEELGFPVYFAHYTNGDLSVQGEVLESQKKMVHACESETSLLMALDEDLIDPIYKETKGPLEYVLDAENKGILSTFHKMEQHTPNGVKGNSYLATPEKGKKMVERFVKGMADTLSNPEVWKQTV